MVILHLNKMLTLNLFTLLILYGIIAPKVHAHFKLPQILLGGNNNNGPVPNPVDIVKSWIPQPDCGIRCRIQEHFRPETPNYQQQQQFSQQNSQVGPFHPHYRPQTQQQHSIHRPHQFYGVPPQYNPQNSQQHYNPQNTPQQFYPQNTPQQFHPQNTPQYFTPPQQHVQQTFNNQPHQTMIYQPSPGQPQIQEPTNTHNLGPTIFNQPRPGQPQIQEPTNSNILGQTMVYPPGTNQPQIQEPTNSNNLGQMFYQPRPGQPQIQEPTNSNNLGQMFYQPRPGQPQIQEPVHNSQFRPNPALTIPDQTMQYQPTPGRPQIQEPIQNSPQIVPPTSDPQTHANPVQKPDEIPLEMDINQGFNPPFSQQNQQSNIYAPVPLFPNTNISNQTEYIFTPNKQDQPTHSNMLHVDTTAPTILPEQETNDFIYPDSQRYKEEIDNISRLIDVRRRRSIES